MIIELCGMPGGGKSTLAQRLVVDGWTRVEIRGLTELVILNFRRMLCGPVTYFQVLSYAWTDASKGNSWWSKYTNLLHYHARYQKALSIDKAILDQGYLQNFISVFEHSATRNEFVRYARLIPKADKYVMFVQPVESSLVRTADRHYEIREREGSAAFVHKLSLMKDNSQLLIENSSLLARPFLVADGLMPFEEAYSLVRNFL